MKIYLVVELYKNSEPPRIVGAFKSKKSAERVAYGTLAAPEAIWRNVIPLRVMEG